MVLSYLGSIGEAEVEVLTKRGGVGMRGLMGTGGRSFGCWVQGCGKCALGAGVLVYRYSGVLVYRDSGV